MRCGAPCWTAGEEAILRGHYKQRGARWCAERLGRGVHGVYARAMAIGLGEAKRPWTDREEELLRRHYRVRGAKWCAAQIGRSHDAVRTRAMQNGLTGRAHPWTDADEDLLREYYRTRGSAWCAAQLGRNINTVRHRAALIGVARSGKDKAAPPAPAGRRQNAGERDWRAFLRAAGDTGPDADRPRDPDGLAPAIEAALMQSWRRELDALLERWRAPQPDPVKAQDEDDFVGALTFHPGNKGANRVRMAGLLYVQVHKGGRRVWVVNARRKVDGQTINTQKELGEWPRVKYKDALAMRDAVINNAL